MNLVLISAVLVAAAWAAPPNRQLQELVDSGALSDLRWPNFTRVQADVTRFYDLNDYQPVWTRNGDATPQAQALIGVLENAALKGLDAEDYDGSRWNSRLSHLRTDAEANRFDLALTISAMRYISDVSSGKVDPKVFSFGLHFDIKNCDLGETIRKLVSSSDVAADLDRVEPPFEGYWRTQKALAHYLELSREATLTQRNTSLAKQVRKLQLVLERWRWAPHSFPRPPIVVNIPEFKLRAYDDRYRPELEMKVVVGKAYRHKTPVFSGSITHLIFRPYWDVPLSIQRAELVPKVAKDPAYLAKNDYEVVNVERQVVSSSSVSADMLAQLRSGKLLIRQIPGDKNALGPVKFLFPNEYNVYLHGTPVKSLFLKSRRDFSHGCIRVEKPEELAQWVLRDLPGWDMDHIREAEDGADSHRVNLDKPIPVLIVYGTAVVREDGEVSFYDDIYGHDAELERLLDHGYPYSGWQPTSAARDPHPRE